MKLSTMRLADRWIGLPMCLTLTIVLAAGRALRAAGHRLLLGIAERPEWVERPVRSILFVKLAEQGSTVLAVPAIRRAVEMVGRENVYWLVFEENRFILDVMDLIPRENVISVRTGGLLATLGGCLGAVGRARRLGVDAAVDLEFFARSSAIFTALSGARTRVGLHGRGAEGPWRGGLMTHRARYNPHLHTASTFRHLVDLIGVDPSTLPASGIEAVIDDRPPPAFRPTPDELDRVAALLPAGVGDVGDVGGGGAVAGGGGSGGGGGGRLVLLNANCSDLIPLRAWPRERYVELARRLLAARPDVAVAFTGAKDEAPAAEELVRRIGDDPSRCFSLAGRTTLPGLLTLYTMAEVLVTNDSGPAHFATLTPIDVVTLFGPEHPSLFAARSPRNHVVHAGLACSPCVSALNNRQSRCADNLCMQAITVDRVLAEVTAALDARASGRGGGPGVVELKSAVRLRVVPS